VARQYIPLASSRLALAINIVQARSQAAGKHKKGAKICTFTLEKIVYTKK
jgi:hypothetical protein